ncbi:MAG TPA: MBL fold metallo-hydrolase [Steroidobacteraceae bacterium]|jgi:competence protein ComEC
MTTARLVTLVVIAWLFAPIVSADDCIAPTSEVVNGVVLRAAPTTSSAKRGSLLPGQRLPLVASVPNWYETRVGSQTAYANKRWVVAAACDESLQPPAAAAGASLTIDVFDVGTGLSVLARGADFSLLYDAGSNDDFATGANNRTIAYLKHVAPELTKLDHVVLSHPHRDHVALLPDVIDQYPVGDVWDSGSRGNLICDYLAFLHAILAKPSIRYHTATRGSGAESIALGTGDCPSSQPRSLTIQHAARIDSTPLALGTSATMEFLYADGTSYTEAQDPNRNSLVLRITLGTRRVLFMGDAPGGARAAPTQPPDQNSIEWKLLQCCTQDLPADVVIVGHHGSMTSSRGAFMNAVGASIFAVSAGPKKYGSVTLPDASIIQALKLRGKVFETDINDAQCLHNSAKVGNDNDNRPGGCDAIHITIPGSGAITADYNRSAD